MEERGQSLRKGFRTLATVRVAQHVFQVRTLEINPSGIALAVAANPPVGMLLELDLSIPVRGGPARVHAKGQVTHSVLSSAEGGFRVGVKFVALDEAARNAIDTYLHPAG